MDLREFWEISPYELSLKVEAFQNRRKYTNNMLVQTAYLTAYYHRVKKMPSLKEILKDDEEKPKAKTTDDMYDLIQKLNSSFGGEVIDGSSQ